MKIIKTVLMILTEFIINVLKKNVHNPLVYLNKKYYYLIQTDWIKVVVLKAV